MASNPTSIKMHNRVQELTSPSETTLGQNLSVNLSQSRTLLRIFTISLWTDRELGNAI